ncbi:hypothetical protein EGI11_04760 [Chryseobacterium sp. H3056]|uniref:Uncharacterized protein n=1 Tax=Kaistella daneshvariae TaxID=2487074 RepID=A0A3N0WYJ4_9FLAO|nr:hypothetical protein [Kaistella daneshvariae]ROI10063.1 hypothetical protein EGI11_04760 [Kaistella daneshvariae]
MMKKISLILFSFLYLTYFSQSRAKLNEENANSFYYLMEYKSSDTLQHNGQQMFVLNVQNGRSVFSSVKNISRDSILEIQKHQFYTGQTNFSMRGVPLTAYTYYLEK